MTTNIDVSSLDGVRRFGNSLVTIRLASREGADDIGIIEHRLPKGDGPPMHLHHREDEIFHILEGTLRMVVGGRERLAVAGDTLIAPKGIPHAFRVESEGGARFLTVVRGRDFESMVVAASRPTEEREPGEATAPTPEMAAELERLCRANHIDLVGPPLH